MASLTGKVIAITGAAGGIGSATAAVLASKGATLSLADTDKQALDKTAEDLREKYGVDVLTAEVDVLQTEQIDRWINDTVERFSKLSGGVNMAGTLGKDFGLKPAHEICDKDFDLVMAVNVRGLMAAQRAQLRKLEDGGSIVNTASISAKMGMPHASAYAASKHAVIGLTRVAAAENGHRNIRVNAIAPGSIDTKMLDQASRAGGLVSGKGLAPIDRKGKPEEVGELVAFLLSDNAAFISGAVYTIDGGATP